jgi:hypothetical protein
MDTSFSIGALLPLWILGAPLALALFSMFTTPRSVSHVGDRGRRDSPLTQAEVAQRP